VHQRKNKFDKLKEDGHPMVQLTTQQRLKCRFKKVMMQQLIM
jgi:hypothetical protein